MPNLKLFTDYIINITAIRADRSSFYLSSFMLEDISETNNPDALRKRLASNTSLFFVFLQ